VSLSSTSVAYVALDFISLLMLYFLAHLYWIGLDEMLSLLTLSNLVSLSSASIAKAFLDLVRCLLFLPLACFFAYDPLS
jgi:hypothetical protein